MIRLVCVLEQEEDYPFKVVVGQEYDPIDCKEYDGEWHYLIEKSHFFEYWYPDKMFKTVHYNDAELDEYVKELFQHLKIQQC